jgi:hypothetical protein
MRGSTTKEQLLRETWDTLTRARSTRRVWFLAPGDFLHAYLHFDLLPWDDVRFVIDQPAADRLTGGVPNIQERVYVCGHIHFGIACSQEWFEVLQNVFSEDLFVNFLI